MQPTHESPQMIRQAFWKHWLQWKAVGARLVADCAWPVEARFLAACVDDNLAANGWFGPYPLFDIASISAAHGLDPLEKRPRRYGESPEHNPLCDAKQSARILLTLLAEWKGKLLDNPPAATAE